MGMNMVPLLMGMLVAVLPLLVVVVLRDALLHRTCAARTHTRIAPCAHGHEHGTLAHGYARSRLALASSHISPQTLNNYNCLISQLNRIFPTNKYRRMYVLGIKHDSEYD